MLKGLLNPAKDQTDISCPDYNIQGIPWWCQEVQVKSHCLLLLCGCHFVLSNFVVLKLYNCKYQFVTGGKGPGHHPEGEGQGLHQDQDVGGQGQGLEEEDQDLGKNKITKHFFHLNWFILKYWRL